MALKKAAQAHHEGEPPEIAREALAIAREIIEAIRVLREMLDRSDADGGVATMQAELDAVVKLIVIDAPRVARAHRAAPGASSLA